MPKFCFVEETNKVYCVNPKEIIIQCEGKTSKVPFTDTFYIVRMLIIYYNNLENEIYY